MRARRKVILALGAGSLAAPLAVFAQKSYRIGFLASEARSEPNESARFDAFRAGLRGLGYIEGRNIVIEGRWADGAYDRLPALAAELVALKVDVIVSSGTKASVTAHNATTKVPIVVGGAGDVVGLGLTTNLARPSSNVTGRVNLGPEIGSKLLELVKEAAPRVGRAAFVINPADRPPYVQRMQGTASSLKVDLTLFEVRAPDELDDVFARIAAARCDAVVVSTDTMFGANSRRVAELALKHRLVSASALSDFADVGGLVSFGTDRLEGYRRAGVFVDRILKGAKPADLPVEQPERFDLVINMTTAKALGITIPQSLAVRARLI
jgi:putative ABC transport system substrate-binding protein